MRALIFLAAMVVLGVGVSETAEAESWKRCKTMTRQVEHFYGIVDLAKARENVLWEQATRKHIADLEDKRLSQCPRYIERSQQIAAIVRHQKNVEEMKKLMKIAADLAIKYYTGGFY